MLAAASIGNAFGDAHFRMESNRGLCRGLGRQCLILVNCGAGHRKSSDREATHSDTHRVERGVRSVVAQGSTTEFAARTHRVVLTRAEELHLVDGTCRAVRDRASGRWLAEHGALGASLRGSRGSRTGDCDQDAASSRIWPGSVKLGAVLVLESAESGLLEPGVVLGTETRGRGQSERILEQAAEATRSAARAGVKARSGRRVLPSLAAVAGLLPWM